MRVQTTAIPIERIAAEHTDQRDSNAAFEWRDDTLRIVVPVDLDADLDETRTIQLLRKASAVVEEQDGAISLIGIYTETASAQDRVGQDGSSLAALAEPTRAAYGRLEDVLASVPSGLQPIDPAFVIADEPESAIVDVAEHSAVDTLLLHQDAVTPTERVDADSLRELVSCDVLVDFTIDRVGQVYVPEPDGPGVELASTQFHPDRILLLIDTPVQDRSLAAITTRALAREYDATVDVAYCDDGESQTQTCLSLLEPLVRRTIPIDPTANRSYPKLEDTEYDVAIGSRDVHGRLEHVLGEWPPVGAVSVQRGRESARTPSEDEDVMCAIDEGDDGEPTVIIADTSTDDAWISAPESDSYRLDQE
ncbi:hypothetical protein OB955_24775 [Halobacteria archaeon AArc-m2/3/4]|uniref:Uncharacterized protein n=1 Tax=Natronoglomus mannanivorans TaxID=2979990 RepID=A0AAP2YZT0_9EURY|nr:hypothetical protein [Halobacteria archaeon AArc-xg1-1]MCU4975898.1 hypothetical protein [Halobacteria archaeon AArc-m2/3/4]